MFKVNSKTLTLSTLALALLLASCSYNKGNANHHRGGYHVNHGNSALNHIGNNNHKNNSNFNQDANNSSVGNGSNNSGTNPNGGNNSNNGNSANSGLNSGTNTGGNTGGSHQGDNNHQGNNGENNQGNSDTSKDKEAEQPKQPEETTPEIPTPEEASVPEETSIDNPNASDSPTDDNHSSQPQPPKEEETIDDNPVEDTNKKEAPEANDPDTVSGENPSSASNPYSLPEANKPLNNLAKESIEAQVGTRDNSNKYRIYAGNIASVVASAPSSKWGRGFVDGRDYYATITEDYLKFFQKRLGSNKKLMEQGQDDSLFKSFPRIPLSPLETNNIGQLRSSADFAKLAERLKYHPTFTVLAASNSEIHKVKESSELNSAKALLAAANLVTHNDYSTAKSCISSLSSLDKNSDSANIVVGAFPDSWAGGKGFNSLCTTENGCITSVFPNMSGEEVKALPLDTRYAYYFANVNDSKFNERKDYLSTVADKVKTADLLYIQPAGKELYPGARQMSMALTTYKNELKDIFPGLIKVVQYDVTGNDNNLANTCSDLKEFCVAAYGSFTVNGKKESSPALAASYVGTLAGAVKGAFPWMSNNELQQTLLTSARPVGSGAESITINNSNFRDANLTKDFSPNAQYGWGLVDPALALRGPRKIIRDFYVDFSKGKRVSVENKDSDTGGTISHYRFENPIAGDSDKTIFIKGDKQAPTNHLDKISFYSDGSFAGKTIVSGSHVEVAVHGNMENSFFYVDREAVLSGRGVVGELKNNGTVKSYGFTDKFIKDANSQAMRDLKYIFETYLPAEKKYWRERTNSGRDSLNHDNKGYFHPPIKNSSGKKILRTVSIEDQMRLGLKVNGDYYQDDNATLIAYTSSPLVVKGTAYLGNSKLKVIYGPNAYFTWSFKDWDCSKFDGRDDKVEACKARKDSEIETEYQINGLVLIANEIKGKFSNVEVLNPHFSKFRLLRSYFTHDDRPDKGKDKEYDIKMLGYKSAYTDNLGTLTSLSYASNEEKELVFTGVDNLSGVERSFFNNLRKASDRGAGAETNSVSAPASNPNAKGLGALHSAMLSGDKQQTKESYLSFSGTEFATLVSQGRIFTNYMQRNNSNLLSQDLLTDKQNSCNAGFSFNLDFSTSYAFAEKNYNHSFNNLALSYAHHNLKALLAFQYGKGSWDNFYRPGKSSLSNKAFTLAGSYSFLAKEQILSLETGLTYNLGEANLERKVSLANEHWDFQHKGIKVASLNPFLALRANLKVRDFTFTPTLMLSYNSTSLGAFSESFTKYEVTLSNKDSQEDLTAFVPSLNLALSYQLNPQSLLAVNFNYSYFPKGIIKAQLADSQESLEQNFIYKEESFFSANAQYKQALSNQLTLGVKGELSRGSQHGSLYKALILDLGYRF